MSSGTPGLKWTWCASVHRHYPLCPWSGFGLQSLSGWLLSPFDMTPVVFENCLTFWNDKMFGACVVYFLLQNWNQPFPWTIPFIFGDVIFGDCILYSRDWLLLKTNFKPILLFLDSSPHLLEVPGAVASQDFGRFSNAYWLVGSFSLLLAWLPWVSVVVYHLFIDLIASKFRCSSVVVVFFFCTCGFVILNKISHLSFRDFFYVKYLCLN